MAEEEKQQVAINTSTKAAAGETANETTNKATDTGLACLVMLGRFLGVPVEPNQLYHQFGTARQKFTATEIILAARHLKLKAKKTTSAWQRLGKISLPAIAMFGDDHFVLLAKASDDQVLVQDPRQQSPQTLSKEEFETKWNGELILMSKRSLIPGVSGKFDISWFIPALLKYKKLFGEVLLASFFIQLFALITPIFFQVVIDKVLVHQGLTTLHVLAIGLLIIALFDVVLNGLRTYLFSHTTNRIDVSLGAKLYNHLVSLPVNFFKSRQVGNIVARVSELETIRNFITGSALTLIIDLAFTFVFFIVMYFYSPTLTYIVLGSIPFYILLSIFITPILRTRLNEKFKRGAENQAFLVESITGVDTVKSLAVEPQMQRRWEEQLAGYISASFRSTNLSNIANQVAAFINKIVIVLILWVGAFLVIDGSISVGQLIAFNMLASRVSSPILRLVQLWQDFQQALISIDRLGDILNSPKEPGHNPNRTTLPDIKGKVSFENVTFRYQPDRPVVLNNVSLEANAGEVIGIVGRSGSGKSTLSTLIQRLYVPNSGRILIDGIDLALVQPSWLRRQVGVVLQEDFLFNRSVKENIALSDPGMSIDAVIKAAKLSGAHEFISELPDAYDTLVGERGSNLSGGQKQRIAIARALVTNPRILIFDEATSALDYESERMIQDNMRSICHNRTVFIIAHRLTTVRTANRIIVLDKGQIIEEGNHHELIALSGHYAKLHEYQNSPPSNSSEAET